MKYIIIAIVMAIIMYGLVCFVLYLPVEKDNAEQIFVVVESGWGLHQTADAVSDAGLLNNKYLFMMYVGVRGKEKNIKAGKYIFSKSMNIPEIASKLENGFSESTDIVVAIPEGFNIWEINKLLTGGKLISEGQFASRFKDDEGYLFPDTYRINEKLKLNNLEFIDELREKMRANYQNKTEVLFDNLDSIRVREIMITASILEKEAKTEEDMSLVAGIIGKRLKMGIPLQIDAAVIYGACLRIFKDNNYLKNCDVTFQGPVKEIKIDGPYNTYMRKGLPVGPISNPGIKAIKAALNPQESDYLYYLSTRDGSQMIYSKTSAEHTANRKKYLGI